jgi:hypothetical protein
LYNTTAHPKSVIKTLQNTLHPGISLTNTNKNCENKIQSFNNTTHNIEVTTNSVMPNKPTDNFILVNHSPDNVENISLFQNTITVLRREEMGLLKERHIDNITVPLITKTIARSERPDISHATLINEEHFCYQHLYSSAFLSKNNSENTTVVKTNDNTLLLSFTNLQTDQRHQPHLVENTTTTDIVECRAVKIHESPTLTVTKTLILTRRIVITVTLTVRLVTLLIK